MDNLGKVRQVVGIFRDADKLQVALDKLGLAHFERRDISVLDSESKLKKELWEKRGKLEGIKNSSQAPEAIHIAPEEFGVAAGAIIGITVLISVIIAFLIKGDITTPEPTATIIVSIVIGIIIGGIITKILQKIRTEYLSNQLAKGGLIVWVNASDKHREKLARRILKKFGARNIHIRKIRVYQ